MAAVGAKLLFLKTNIARIRNPQSENPQHKKQESAINEESGYDPKIGIIANPKINNNIPEVVWER